MEKKLYHHGSALTLYDELDNGAGVYCSRQGSDGAALVLFYMKNHLADAYIPGVWWISHKGQAQSRTLPLALDLFFDTSVDVDLKLPLDAASFWLRETDFLRSSRAAQLEAKELEPALYHGYLKAC